MCLLGAKAVDKSDHLKQNLDWRLKVLSLGVPGVAGCQVWSLAGAWSGFGELPDA